MPPQLQSAPVQAIEPRLIKQNPDNPRLIFHEDELNALEESIREQGILVPLTVFEEGRGYTLLDGERRWRCALRLGLGKVPAIIQAKPNRVANIMMMFAIHNARRDWDPLPTALKLEEMQKILFEARGEQPTERQLAAAASMSVGEIRRYKKILSLPSEFKSELLLELNKPRSHQKLTVDHVVEAVSGSARLVKAGVIDDAGKQHLIEGVIEKFRNGILKSTVEPRRLSRIARAVERQEISGAVVRRELNRFMARPQVTLEDVFDRTVESADFIHATDTIVSRSMTRLQEIRQRGLEISPELERSLRELAREIKAVLG